MSQKGLTLLELILAITMMTGVLFAVHTLNLFSLNVSLNAAQDIKMLEELDYVFRDMSLCLRDGISKGYVWGLPGSPAGSHGHFTTPRQGPYFYRQDGTANLWLGTLLGSGFEVWYGYSYNSTTQTGTVVRQIFNPGADPGNSTNPTGVWGSEVMISGSTSTPSANILGPWALNGPDLDGDGTIEATPDEKTIFNNCITNMTAAYCESKSDPKVYPVFQVNTNNRKNIYVSFQGKSQVGQKRTVTSGMTKTIFLHGESG